jgi:hypothetical protein
VVGVKKKRKKDWTLGAKNSACDICVHYLLPARPPGFTPAVNEPLPLFIDICNRAVFTTPQYLTVSSAFPLLCDRVAQLASPRG